MIHLAYYAIDKRVFKLFVMIIILIQLNFKLKKNSKYFWKFVKSKVTSNCFPDTMFYNGFVVSGGDDICHLFSKYFNSVYQPSSTYCVADVISSGSSISINSVKITQKKS